MLHKLFITGMLLIHASGFSQSPDWIHSNKRNAKYPKANYLVGFASYKNQNKLSQEDFLEKMKSYAQTELVQSVQIHIESASVSSTREENENFSQLFMMSSVATSGMTIAGLEFETWYDKKSNTGYALAYAKRENTRSYYASELKKTETAIVQKLEQANALIGQNANKLKLLNSTFIEFRNAEQAQSILYALSPGIHEDDLLLGKFKELKTKIENLKTSLEKTTAEDLNEAASLLAIGLKSQLSNDIKQVRLIHLSYQDTKMGSTFSRRFSTSLEQKLSSETGLAVLTDVYEPSQAAKLNLLSGTYWEEGNNLRIILVLKDIAANKTLASAEAKLSKNWLNENKISYTPENFRQAFINMKAFKTNEVAGGGLQAEIWTNKGDQNLIFSEGDKMKLFVRVNHECYIRVVYHLADGSRVLLVDNYYVGSDKINAVYELPYEFECSEPFGAETLQLNAQTTPFDKLNVTHEYGYDFITETLNDILTNSRGFKKVTDNVLKAEKRVVITTMKE